MPDSIMRLQALRRQRERFVERTMVQAQRRFWMRCLVALGGILALPVQAAPTPAACPPAAVEVTRSRGGVIAHVGTVAGVPDLCRQVRADGPGDYYFGVWRSDWPGAGEAYPVIKAVLDGGEGTRYSFITRSVPGLQWIDSYVHNGTETLEIGGKQYLTIRLAHEREGIEGNTYHSIITSWRDVATGIGLKTVENQIAGQSYGPDTTWTAVQVRPLAP